MTTPKIDSQFTEAVGHILALHADRLYRDLGSCVIAVVELKSVDELRVAADEDKGPWVKLRLTSMEIATGAHEAQVRNVQEALYRVRTSKGTIDEVAPDAHRTIELAAQVVMETPYDGPEPAEDDNSADDETE